MRGNPRNQSGQIYRAINKVGHSRHAAKTAARLAGAVGAHAVAQSVGVFSYSTMRRYRQITTAFLSWCREEHGTKDAAKVTPEHVEHWLQEKIADGVRYQTFLTHCSALNKMSIGLSVIYKRDYKWREAIDHTRVQAREYLDRSHKPRGFADPGAVIEHMDGNSRICAQLQYLGGARSSEVSKLSERNLIGDGRILLTNTKGGRRRIMRVSQQLYGQVADVIHREGVFVVDYRRYLNDIRSACAATEQKYSGSHDFRHSFAQLTMADCQRAGMSYEDSLRVTAERLGHNRVGVITERYCR